jgi:hypothetical protein
MKLRIKGDSLRLRVSRSELDHFSPANPLQETIHFGPAPDATLTYALAWAETIEQPDVTYASQTVTVRIPSELARQWKTSDAVSIAATVDLGSAGTLDVLVEKDFACLNHSDADNADAFPNPNLAGIC